MDPSNFANRHDQLGLRGNTPTSTQDKRQGGGGKVSSQDALNSTQVKDHHHHHPQVNKNNDDNDETERGSDYSYGPGVQGTQPTADHDRAARDLVASRTEIGNPHSLLPAPGHARAQLAAIRRSELPVDAVRTAQYGIAPSPDTYEGAGYEKSLNDDDDGTTGGGGGGGGTSYIPRLPPRTDVRDYAFDNHHVATNTEEIPGASVGKKIKRVVAQGHVSLEFPESCTKNERETVFFFFFNFRYVANKSMIVIKGASEVLRGNIKAAIDHTTGDKARQAEDDEIVRQGQREYLTNRKFEG